MIEKGLNNLFWGFLFISLDFRICGFDILPDVIGFILFAMAFSQLKEHSQHFSKASTLNIFTIILSIFSIYEVKNNNSGITFGILGPFGILVGLASLILTLYVIYNLFMGMKEMLHNHDMHVLAEEAYISFYSNIYTCNKYLICVSHIYFWYSFLSKNHEIFK